LDQSNHAAVTKAIFPVSCECFAVNLFAETDEPDIGVFAAVDHIRDVATGGDFEDEGDPSVMHS
jgi:hypothetical protein